MNLDEKIVLMCAMRYALGRMTYVVSSVTDEIIKHWDEFGKGDQEVIHRDIEKAPSLGMSCDQKRWMYILTELKVKDA